MNSAEYWAQRFAQLEEAQNQQGKDALNEIERQYRRAQKQIEGKISEWYQRFAVNNGISLADARQYLKTADLKELRWDVKDYIRYGEENAINQQWMRELENASAKFHISKYEALKIQTRQSLEALFAKQHATVFDTMSSVFTSGYYHSVYEIQKGFGIGWDISGIDQAQLEKVLSKPWAVDGKNFSERIWDNKEKLIATVHNELTQNIMLGGDPQKAIDAIAKKMNSSKQNAGRLVMTEEAYFSSAAQKEAFEELDVEKYEIVATLDSHTSEICRELDGQLFPMTDFKPGITAPPFHVRCRSTTVPHFDEDFEQIGQRAAKYVDNKTYYVPDDMTYQEWKDKFVKEHGHSEWDYYEKSAKNKIRDKKQFEKYKAVLGKNAPKSLEEFQKIMYNKNEWDMFKAYSNSIKSGELTPLADFKLYKQISKEIDEILIGQKTSNGIPIKGKSNHFIARVIGSVEQKRSGIDLNIAFIALTSDKAIVFPIRDSVNGQSQKFRYNGVEVTVNPKTGILIQANPRGD